MLKRDEQIFQQIVWYSAVWKEDFSQMICQSWQTSQRRYDINSHQTDKCQTICPSRRFVRPLVWKRPISSLTNIHIQSSNWYSIQDDCTCLLAISSSLPSPTTTYVHFFPNRFEILSKHVSFPEKQRQQGNYDHDICVLINIQYYKLISQVSPKF